MKAGIHPTYYPAAQVMCSCGNSWTVGSTSETIRTDVCNVCHPFFTGEQRIVDTEGQVDRFYQRLERRQQIREEIDAHRQAVESGAVSIAELELGSRTENVLRSERFETVADLLRQLDEGDDSLLRIQGFGQKSLIDLKKKLRASGYID